MVQYSLYFARKHMNIVGECFEVVLHLGGILFAFLKDLSTSGIIGLCEGDKEATHLDQPAKISN
jgi:hypothetical protein